MRRFAFKVEGLLPPKKDGANSMWGKPIEARRLAALRSSAFSAFSGQPPLERQIRFWLYLHVPAKQTRGIGDLDNFVTGVCDGLMAADTRSIVDDTLKSCGVPCSTPIGIVDDAEVVHIHAKKIGGAGRTPWYEVILEGD